MSKFQYAPGLPGYGTQGADGSDGSQGLGIYFSDLDGGSQSSAIRTRIENNLSLSGTGAALPGSRVYQNGDIFVDINGLVYEIDDSFNRYTATGSRLNTSTIFIEGIDTSTDVQYTRYYNSYLTTDKFIVDNVYSAIGVGNYAQNPNEAAGIYGIAGLNYAQVNYVDLSVGDYLPFTLWSSNIDTGKPEDTIALVKDYQSNTWRWGNYNTNTSNIRDVSIYFDFSKIIASGNVDVDGSLMVSGNVDVDGSLSVGTIKYDNLNVYTLDAVGAGSVAAGNLSFSTGVGTPDSETSSNSLSGSGGSLTMLLGSAGDSSVIGSFDAYGAVGAKFTLKSGDGGRAWSTSGDAYGGNGGDVSIMGGEGGYAEGSSTTEGGDGGNLYLSGGNGGIGAGDQGGDGGDVNISAGEGGAGSTSGIKGNVNISSQSFIANINSVTSISSGFNINLSSAAGDVNIQSGSGSGDDINLDAQGNDVNVENGNLEVVDGYVQEDYYYATNSATTWTVTPTKRKFVNLYLATGSTAPTVNVQMDNFEETGRPFEVFINVYINGSGGNFTNLNVLLQDSTHIGSIASVSSYSGATSSISLMFHLVYNGGTGGVPAGWTDMILTSNNIQSARPVENI